MGPLADLAEHTAFPGRVRQFAAADPGQAVALAVGAAWAEQARGGHAAAVVPTHRRDEPLVLAALALAARLGLGNLTLLDIADPTLPCERLVPREWQPVHLASLPRDLRPPWQAGPPAQALSACAEREPLLLLPARDPRWGCDRAALLALAWIAGEGRRVAWELPRGCPLDTWSSDLALIGAMQLPLKLLCDPADLPWPPAERGLGLWWVAMPGAVDTAGALAWALLGEETVLLALPEALGGGEAWLPGSARRLADGGAGTRLCTAARPPGATPPGVGVLQLTSLVPLPYDALHRAAEPWSTDDEDLARHLASLDPRLRCALAPSTVSPHLPR
jgi:hypothetical protein